MEGIAPFKEGIVMAIEEAVPNTYASQIHQSDPDLTGLFVSAVERNQNK